MKGWRLALLLLLTLLASPAAAQNWPGQLQGTVDTNGLQFGTQRNFPTVTGQRTLVPLDAASVVTGGVAVTALLAGHRTAGGWLLNPATAIVPLCINEQGPASGTTSSGNTTCVAPGQTYVVAPAAGAVSAVSSDSAHPFSGVGFN